MSDTETGCIIPVLQAAVIAALSGVLVLALGMWQAWSAPGWPALAAAALAGLVTFVSGVARWRRSDSGDMAQYYPASYQAAEVSEQTTRTVRVELVSEGGRRLNLIDLPASDEQLAGLAAGLLAGQSFSEAQWCGARGLFSRSEFNQLRGEMLRRGLCSWNNPHTPARGATLTPAGRALMRTFETIASQPPHPTGRDPDY